MIEWVEDQDNVITDEALGRHFGPIGAEQLKMFRKESEQVHVALLSLTESESFDFVLGAAPSGLEAFETMGPSLGSTEWKKA